MEIFAKIYDNYQNSSEHKLKIISDQETVVFFDT